MSGLAAVGRTVNGTSCPDETPVREQPIFTTRAHVFQIDPNTKKNWVPASKQAVTVSYFYDSTRNSYRIISVDGSKVIINSTITPNMTFTKTSQKFGQWADSRANTVFGLGFPSEQHLAKFAEKFLEVKEAAKLAKDKSQESQLETSSNHSQESGRGTPSSTQASSFNGTDDEKIIHVGPADVLLRSENESLKAAVEQSSTNVKKWEVELQTLRASNARLVDSLHESNTNVESWKKQLLVCQEECAQLQNKITVLEAQCNEGNQDKETNAKLNLRVKELGVELKDKDQELENLRKQAEIIPQLMGECDSITEKLKAAELRNSELEARVEVLQKDVDERQQQQGNMKHELKKLTDTLDGKLDELQEFRQGLSKLGADN
ncbi:hypothetical protein SKAU_G00313050 [Synaphobranchus kaupii]|uniref:WH1 domain-containing protein n=1 Tax=Synaphobranchus kaupii TaxID=118154 RepID=A0A9Q1IKH4_SYNKA|nr:hypothetical protein SKAU_G00313050 [Synaphobranchus kaupii]